MEIELFLKQVYLTVTLLAIVVVYLHARFSIRVYKSEDDIPIYIGLHHIFCVAWLISLVLSKAF